MSRKVGWQQQQCVQEIQIWTLILTSCRCIFNIALVSYNDRWAKQYQGVCCVPSLAVCPYVRYCYTAAGMGDWGISPNFDDFLQSQISTVSFSDQAMGWTTGVWLQGILCLFIIVVTFIVAVWSVPSLLLHANGTLFRSIMLVFAADCWCLSWRHCSRVPTLHLLLFPSTHLMCVNQPKVLASSKVCYIPANRMAG